MLREEVGELTYYRYVSVYPITWTFNFEFVKYLRLFFQEIEKNICLGAFFEIVRDIGEAIKPVLQ